MWHRGIFKPERKRKSLQCILGLLWMPLPATTGQKHLTSEALRRQPGQMPELAPFNAEE